MAQTIYSSTDDEALVNEAQTEMPLQKADEQVMESDQDHVIIFGTGTLSPWRSDRLP